MKTLSAKLANVIENAARGAIPEARFGREFAPSPSKDGTAGPSNDWRCMRLAA